MRQGNAMRSLSYYLLGQRVEADCSSRVLGEAGAIYPTVERRRGIQRPAPSRSRGRQGGRTVILGGHSAGAVTVPAYATWSFHGHPGYKDLAGLLQIDGAEFGAFDAYLKGTDYSPPYTTKRQASEDSPGTTASRSSRSPARRSVRRYGRSSGVIPEIACQFARDDPQGKAVLQSAIPEILRKLVGLPRFPITNEALMGVYTTDHLISAFQMRTGKLATSGSPRRWINGPYSSVPSVCKTFTQEPGNGLEWYYSARLDVDLFQAMPTLEPTGAMHSPRAPSALPEGRQRPVVRVPDQHQRRRRSARDEDLHPQIEGQEPLALPGSADRPLRSARGLPGPQQAIQTVVPWLRDIVAGHDPGAAAKQLAELDWCRVFRGGRVKEGRE